MNKLGNVKYFSLLVMLFVTVLLGACKEKRNEEPNPEPKVEFKLEVDAADFTSEAGTRELSVQAPEDTWTATSSADWCLVERKGDKLVISVKENATKELREATVTIKVGDETKTLSIRQMAQEGEITLLVNTTFIAVPKAGNTICFEVTSNKAYTIQTPAWVKVSSSARVGSLKTKKHYYQVLAHSGELQRLGDILIFEKGKEDSGAKAVIKLRQKGSKTYTPASSAGIKKDVKVEIKSGQANQAQGGGEIWKSFDGKVNTLYHSPWGNGTRMPVVLEYKLKRFDHIDYLIYTPRQDGNPNGNFGKVDIEYKDAHGKWVKVKSYDFMESSGAAKVFFGENGVEATDVRISVNSGTNGFAACAEMEFFKFAKGGFKATTLFTDESCSELKAGLTMQDIEQCPEPFFKNIAKAMFENSYEFEFRIADYKAYPHPAIQANQNRTNAYSFFDNPTGIKVSAGDELVVLVGDTKGYGLSLQVQGLYANSDRSGYKDGYGPGGQSYPISRGVNKLKIERDGLVYVNYFVNKLEQVETAPKVKIHFATGLVNGYFDTQNPSHRGRWRELLNNAKDECFDLVGKYAHLTMPVHKFKECTPDGKELVDAYDKIVKSEMELLGLYKYNRVFKNRMALIVMYSGYMHATWGRTAYNYTTINTILSANALRTGAVWGPAHEMGHMNQTRPGVRWIGMTEVTNNIMSEYIQTSIMHAKSRLQCEPINWGNNRYTKAWNGVIVHQLPLSVLSIDPYKEESKIPAKYKVNGKPASYLYKDVFCQLVPFWQLQLYFGNVKQMTPAYNDDKSGFYPKVYEWARTHDFMGELPGGDQEGVYQTDFAYIASKASGYDLTDFFVKWGFLREMPQTEIDDYRKSSIHITAERVREVKERIKALNLPKPEEAIEYISDESQKYFIKKLKVVKGSNANVYGRDLKIDGWRNVVVYEIWDKPYGTSGAKLTYVGDGYVYGGDYSLKGNGAKLAVCDYKKGQYVYAVQYDNKRILVPVN